MPVDRIVVIGCFALNNKAKYLRFPDDANSVQATFSRAGGNATRMRSSSKIRKVTSGRVSDPPRPRLFKSLVTGSCERNLKPFYPRFVIGQRRQ